MVKEIITDLSAFDNRADEIDVRKENNLLRETIVNLKHTIQEHNLVALAAPQIGVNKRIMCINFNGDVRTFVNPVASAFKSFTLAKQTCPSIPDKQYIRPRYGEMLLTYQTPMGKIETRKFQGMTAFVAQYAVDILDGLTLEDVGLPLLDGWDELSEDDKDVIINEYLESLDLKRKDIKTEIENNPTLKQMSDAIDFMESVQKGETKLESQD